MSCFLEFNLNNGTTVQRTKEPLEEKIYKNEIQHVL